MLVLTNKISQKLENQNYFFLCAFLTCVISLLACLNFFSQTLHTKFSTRFLMALCLLMECSLSRALCVNVSSQTSHAKLFSGFSTTCSMICSLKARLFRKFFPQVLQMYSFLISTCSGWKFHMWICCFVTLVDSMGQCGHCKCLGVLKMLG